MLVLARDITVAGYGTLILPPIRFGGKTVTTNTSLSINADSNPGRIVVTANATVELLSAFCGEIVTTETAGAVNVTISKPLQSSRSLIVRALGIP